ncbi:MAG: thiol-disulfide oxidoreductase DCC family protein [Candidatus Acidiferrales bacterium]
MPPPATYDIFLDGSCSFCKWTRTKVEPYDTASRLRFLDYNDPFIAAQAPFSRDDLDREMHVRTPNGAWLKGFEAWVALLRVLPKLAWIGRIAGLPPVRWIGPGVYRFIAKHRYSLPGAPSRCDTDTCAVPGRSPK